MARGRAGFKLQRAKEEEERTLQRRAGKKSLWGSVGRTIGGLAAMGLTGGAVNPLTLGAITGAATFAGGALGAGASNVGSLKGGRFFKSDREGLERELGAFGTQNIVSSLKSGITAGIGQKLKFMKSGEEAAKLSEGFGMDFKESMLGRGLEKRAIGKELVEAGGGRPTASGGYRLGGGRKGSMLHDKAPLDSEVIGTNMKLDSPIIDSEKIGLDMGFDPNDPFGETASRPTKPSTPTTSGVFDVDLEDVEETVSASDILSRKKAAMSQFFEDPKNVKELGLYTGRGPEGYRPTTWRPEAGTDLREFSDKYKTFIDTDIAGIPEWRFDTRDWASEAAGLKSQEFQQSLGITERLGLPGSSKSWQSELLGDR